MACLYYRERLGGKVVGYCKDSREGIPSQKHQDCLCKSGTGIYVEFCPIYAKLRRDEQKQGFLSRFMNGSRPKSPQRLEEVKR